MNAATCAATAAATRGLLLPTLVTAMPEPEVDEGVAVDVDHDASAGGDDVRRQHGADAAGDGDVLAGRELTRARAGDLGDQPAFLGKGRSARHGGGRSCGHDFSSAFRAGLTGWWLVIESLLKAFMLTAAHATTA